MPRLALATCDKLPMLNDDDRLLVPALPALGVTAEAAVWDSPDVCWDEFQGVVVRSCWDYHRRLEEFLAWTAGLEGNKVRLWNAPALLRRNSHKSYLRDLAVRGVAVVPTQSRLDALLRTGDVMVQPLVREVGTAGEWSLLFFGGRYSHSVLKRPTPGDYRVQWEFGGTAVAAVPPALLAWRSCSVGPSRRCGRPRDGARHRCPAQRRPGRHHER